MKSKLFNSLYLKDFQVLDEQRGNINLYPHTSQLPKLWEALNREFCELLAPRLLRMDHCAKAFDKFVMYESAKWFCHAMNDARSDEVILHHAITSDLITRLAVVQKITETTPKGRRYQFRFFVGKDFFPDVYLSGKRVVFSDHVLARFEGRAADAVIGGLSGFLFTFYGSVLASMRVGPGKAFVVFWDQSILAFTYSESATEYFITTCLTVPQLNSMEIEGAEGHNLHYGPAFVKPQKRNWDPEAYFQRLYQLWERKAPIRKPEFDREVKKQFRWSNMASYTRREMIKKEQDTERQFCFLDHIPGPLAGYVHVH